MLGKLLKYDFRSMWKQFMVIWPAALILALVNRFTLFGIVSPGGGGSFGEWVGVISMFLFGGVCFAMVVVSFLFVITRFYHGLLGDEGYLMHTLPVRSWQLLLSKLICALVTTVVNGIVGFAALLLMMPLDWTAFFDSQVWRIFFQTLAQQPDILLYFFEVLLLFLAMFAAGFMTLYLAMAIGHLFSRRRVLMSVVACFALEILGGTFTNLLDRAGLLSWATTSTVNGHGELWLAMAAMLIPTGVMFAATSWILTHKLNLE